MQSEPSCVSQDPLNAPGTLIIADGTAPGLVIVPRFLLRQIVAQIDLDATVAPTEDSGLLLGPDPQSDDLLIRIKEAIPLGSEYKLLRLGSEYRLLRSPTMFGAGIESVQLKLAEALREGSHTIVGLYRILSPRQDEVSESGLEFLADCTQRHSSLSNLRCGFEFVPLSASETLLRVLMRQGEQWAQVQELILESAPPTPPLSPEATVMKLNGAVPQRPVRKATAVPDEVHSRYRLLAEGAIVTLLLLLLIVNAFVVSFIRHIPRDTVNLQSRAAQKRELTADVSKLQSPTPPPVPLTDPQTNLRPANAHIAPKQVSDPPPPMRNLVIPMKPSILKLSEAFQFKVRGNPAPEVVWSAEGPGSIDPVYGLYKAPNQFIGETRVKVTASSWAGSQSVTFTLEGAPREEK
jgi:hypothetical protein